VQAALKDPLALPRLLGEYLSEPKSNVWFEARAEDAEEGGLDAGLVLDHRSRMMYDEHHIFINGESYRASGRDAKLMRQLADARRLDARDMAKASPAAVALLQDWCDDGWLHGL
jgi:50S ribosomal protein L16 3-hydroxylase